MGSSFALAGEKLKLQEPHTVIMMMLYSESRCIFKFLVHKQALRVFFREEKLVSLSEFKRPYMSEQTCPKEL
jgi:hypothetical protein